MSESFVFHLVYCMRFTIDAIGWAHRSEDFDVEMLARDFVYMRVIAQFSTLYNSFYVLLISLLCSLLHHL